MRIAVNSEQPSAPLREYLENLLRVPSGSNCRVDVSSIRMNIQKLQHLPDHHRPVAYAFVHLNAKFAQGTHVVVGERIALHVLAEAVHVPDVEIVQVTDHGYLALHFC